MWAATLLGLAGALLLLVCDQKEQVVDALSTGAPSMACMGLRPIHGLNRPKPASASQFFVSQSTLDYSPGQENVTVEIATHSSERFFRGFMVQAYDPSSGSPIGSFLANSEGRGIDSCSAATHRNNQNKRKVSLVWVPSSGSAGAYRQVRFRATIVVTYREFYTGYESSELKFEKFDYSKPAIGAPSSPLAASGDDDTAAPAS